MAKKVTNKKKTVKDAPIYKAPPKKEKIEFNMKNYVSSLVVEDIQKEESYIKLLSEIPQNEYVINKIKNLKEKVEALKKFKIEFDNQ